MLAVLASTGPAHAGARPDLPPADKIFAGVAGPPVSEYSMPADRHPPVYEVFSAWGEYLPGIFQAAAAGARGATPRIRPPRSSAPGSA